IEDLVEVVGCFAHARIGPEGLHNLLAVEAVAWGQSEQLDEAPGLPQAPPILFDEPRSNPHAKAAQQPDAHHLSPVSLSPDRAIAVLLRVLVVVMGCWLELGVTTHLLSPYICFKGKTGCRLLLPWRVAGCATGSARSLIKRPY